MPWRHDLALAILLAGCATPSPGPRSAAPPADPPRASAPPAPRAVAWDDASCATDSEVDRALLGLDPPLTRPTSETTWDGPPTCEVVSFERADLTGDGHPEAVVTVRFARSGRFPGPDGAGRTHRSRATLFAVFDERPAPHALLRLGPDDPSGAPVALELRGGRLRSEAETCSDCGCDRFATAWRWDGEALVPDGDDEMVASSGDCDM